MLRKLLLIGMLACSTLSYAEDNDDFVDSFEGYNRTMFEINQTLDKAIAKPIATAYQDVVPDVVRVSVSNVFGNIGDISNGVNNLLQGKPVEALSDLGRILVNTTFGIYGLFDVASAIGLEKHDEDFGQTLGVWGVPSGSFVVLPILGPSTFRDTAGKPVDFNLDLVTKMQDVSDRNVTFATRAVATRADLLGTERIMEEAALDKYSFVRDAYLQYRQNQIKN